MEFIVWLVLLFRFFWYVHSFSAIYLVLVKESLYCIAWAFFRKISVMIKKKKVSRISAFFIKLLKSGPHPPNNYVAHLWWPRTLTRNLLCWSTTAWFAPADNGAIPPAEGDACGGFLQNGLHSPSGHCDLYLWHASRWPRSGGPHGVQSPGGRTRLPAPKSWLYHVPLQIYEPVP